MPPSAVTLLTSSRFEDLSSVSAVHAPRVHAGLCDTLALSLSLCLAPACLCRAGKTPHRAHARLRHGGGCSLVSLWQTSVVTDAPAVCIPSTQASTTATSLMACTTTMSGPSSTSIASRRSSTSSTASACLFCAACCHKGGAYAIWSGGETAVCLRVCLCMPCSQHPPIAPEDGSHTRSEPGVAKDCRGMDSL